MKKVLSNKEVKQVIELFFQKDSFTSDEMRKIRRLAQKYKIRLGMHRKRFCSGCLNPLKGRIRVSKTHKTVKCSVCNKESKFKIIDNSVD